VKVAAPPRDRTRKRWIVGAGVSVAAAALVFALAVPSTGRDADRRPQCANNLKNIMSIVQERRASKSWRGGRPRGDLLESARLRPGLEWDLVLACPRDEATRARIEERASAEEPGPVPSSYLVRDFERCPLPPGTAEKFPLILCTHHADGVNVGYDDSSVVYLDRPALGLAPEDAIETGPDSKSELLRVFPPRAR
jgi:hypothetical protein